MFRVRSTVQTFKCFETGVCVAPNAPPVLHRWLKDNGMVDPYTIQKRGKDNLAFSSEIKTAKRRKRLASRRIPTERSNRGVSRDAVQKTATRMSCGFDSRKSTVSPPVARLARFRPPAGKNVEFGS